MNDWTEDYLPIERDYEVADAIIQIINERADQTKPIRRVLAREIGIAIAKAIEAEIVP